MESQLVDRFRLAWQGIVVILNDDAMLWRLRVGDITAGEEGRGGCHQPVGFRHFQSPVCCGRWCLSAWVNNDIVSRAQLLTDVYGLHSMDEACAGSARGFTFDAIILEFRLVGLDAGRRL